MKANPSTYSPTFLRTTCSKLVSRKNVDNFRIGGASSNPFRTAPTCFGGKCLKLAWDKFGSRKRVCTSGMPRPADSLRDCKGTNEDLFAWSGVRVWLGRQGQLRQEKMMIAMKCVCSSVFYVFDVYLFTFLVLYSYCI